ncbi:MAG: hypothetical protein P8J87_12915, partial [Verrucomicrobiales bacterium]|nr:hypothetical protein [Verrucomicrobiales bacterium]
MFLFIDFNFSISPPPFLPPLVGYRNILLQRLGPRALIGGNARKMRGCPSAHTPHLTKPTPCGILSAQTDSQIR